ncbi:MAG: diguanylate cyclase, partial [Actinomycetota bacterium]
MEPDDDVNWSLSAEEIELICARNVMATAAEFIFLKDLHSRFIHASQGVSAVHHRTPEEMIGLTDFDLFAPEIAEHWFAEEQAIIASGHGFVHREERERWPDRPDTWVTTTKLPLRRSDGTIIGTFGISRDITARVLAEETRRAGQEQLAAAHDALRQVESRLRAVLDTTPDRITQFDRQLRCEYLNPAAEEALNTSSAAARGRTLGELSSMDQSTIDLWEANLQRVITTGTETEFEFSIGSGDATRWFHARVSPEIGADQQTVGVLTVSRDFTALKQAERKLAHQALHDSLTGLANRALLMDRVTRSLLRIERQAHPVAVLFIDVDHFKAVNDTHGHDIGDEVLRELARRISASVRGIDLACRYGGEEFVVVMP